MKLPACLLVPFALLAANAAVAATGEAEADHGRLPLDQLSLLLGDAPPATMQPRNPRVRGVPELRWHRHGTGPARTACCSGGGL